MKKILVVTEIFHPESGLINDFVKELVNNGYSVDVLTQFPSYPQGYVFPGYKNGLYMIEEWESIMIHRFKVVEGYKDSLIKKMLNYWTFVREGTKLALKIGNDFDEVFVYQTGPLTLALPALAIKKKFKKKVTIWTFDIWPDTVYSYGFPKVTPLAWFLNSIVRKVYNNCDNILVSSKGFIDSIRAYAPHKEITYAPNWMTSEDQEISSLEIDSSKTNFTFAGNISVSQNLKRVLLGWKMAGLPNSELNLVGDGSYLNALKQLVDSEKISNVSFHGRVPSGAVLAILEQSDVLILPLVAHQGIEKTEPFKIQSYLQAKKPIMGVIRGGGREIIENYGLGVCADPIDIADISEKFKQSLIFAKTNGKRVAEASAELIETRFNKKKIVSTILKVLGEK